MSVTCRACKKKTGQTIIITKRGEPIAQVSPLSSKDHEDTDSFGCMSGTAKQIGDIVAPLETEDDYEEEDE